MGTVSGRLLRRAAPLVLLALLASACSKASAGPGSINPSGINPSGASTTFGAAVATTDLFIGKPQRVQVGISYSTQSNGVQLVTFGQVGFAFSYLGATGSDSPAPGPTATADYLPAPTTQASGAGPALSDPSVARGVYQAENVTFPQPGIWQVTVTANVAGQGAQVLTTAFPVLSKPALPAPGEKALRTDNLTLSSKGVPPSAIDSRALDGARIPDPELHRWTIAEALAQHRPILVDFATPTYCVSQWCGPNTDAVAALAKKYSKKAIFIHIEIWRDYSKSQVNKAAADWLYRNGDLVDPWLYLIGSNGVIKDRWAPLFNVEEVAHELAALPNMQP
jgi:hypothetical protein